jgi:hypothetical protein
VDAEADADATELRQTQQRSSMHAALCPRTNKPCKHNARTFCPQVCSRTTKWLSFMHGRCGLSVPTGRALVVHAATDCSFVPLCLVLCFVHMPRWPGGIVTTFSSSVSMLVHSISDSSLSPVPCATVCWGGVLTCTPISIVLFSSSGC